MKFKITCPEDFWAGLMFIAFGLVAVVVSRDYPIGSAMRMGPGYFPTALGGLMIVIGAIVSAASFKMTGERIKPFAWKPVVMLSLSFVVFGWGIDHVGFVPALFGLIILSAAAGQVFRVKEVLILSVILIVGAVGVFIYGIDLPYPLFWWR